MVAKPCACNRLSAALSMLGSSSTTATMVRLFSMKCLGFRLTGKLGQAQIFDVRAFMTESSLGEARRDVATQRHRSHARHAARETERFARGLPATRCCGGARHGQIVAGQGLACDGECNACAVQGRRWATQADRDSPPGYRKPARP